jgi:hypothetical protein
LDSAPICSSQQFRPAPRSNSAAAESDLRVVIYAHLSDPITGVFEYKLTNISRREPPPDLFVMPEEYTIDHCPVQEDPCFRGESMPQANRQDERGHGPIVQ